jgi:hypothetical protein
MRHCAIDNPRCDTGRRRAARHGNSGTALLAALIVMAIVAAMGLGLALSTSLEPLAAANYEANHAARLAAEAGVAIAVHELADIGDWNLALTGAARSAVMEQGDITVDLPDGSQAGLDELTARATCGRPGACLDTERSAITSARPWGPNNPRWQVFGHGRLGHLIPEGAGLPETVVVVWLADDPAEIDGDPLRDSGVGPGGEWRPGGCVLAVRAEAFGARFAHRTLLAIVARPAQGCGPGSRLVSVRGLD